MKVNNVTKWIVIDHKASSLFDVIADGVFKNTTVGKDKWSSLMDGLLSEENDNVEGFNIDIPDIPESPTAHLKVRIGMILAKPNYCNSCDSCFGFGTLVRGCDGETRKTTCGNITVCDELDNKNTAAFGYIFVQ